MVSDYETNIDVHGAVNANWRNAPGALSFVEKTNGLSGEMEDFR